MCKRSIFLGHTHYPVVPGHELAGVVTAVGKNVTNFKVKQNFNFSFNVDNAFCYVIF